MSYKNNDDYNPYRKGNAIAGGLLIVILSLLCIFSLFDWLGGVGKMINTFIVGFFGLAIYGYAFAGLIAGILIMIGKQIEQPKRNIAIVFGILALFVMALQVSTSQELIGNGYGKYLTACYNTGNTAGGLFFGILGFPLIRYITPIASIVVLSLFMVALCIMLLFPYVDRGINLTTKVSDVSKKKKFSFKDRNKSKITNPNEPVLTYFDDEDVTQEAIGNKKAELSYMEVEQDGFVDLEKNEKNSKKNKRLKFDLDIENLSEDNQIDDKIVIDNMNLSDSDNKDLRRKNALKKLYPNKHKFAHSEQVVNSLDSGILNSIKSLKENSEPEKKDDNKLSLKELMEQDRSEDARKRYFKEKLDEINIDKEENGNRNELKNEEIDNHFFTDIHGNKRPYFGVNLNEQLKNNIDNKEKEKLEKKNIENRKFKDIDENKIDNKIIDDVISEPISKDKKIIPKKYTDFSYDKIRKEEKEKLDKKFNVIDNEQKIDDFVRDDMSKNTADIKKEKIDKTEKIEEPEVKEKIEKINKPFMTQKNLDFIKQYNQEEEEVVEEKPIEVKADVPKYNPTNEVSYIAPSVDLLTEYDTTYSNSSDYIEKGEKLEQTLINFGIDATVTDYTQGPTFSRYELKLAQGVKVSKILGVAKDITLALAAKGNIRIEAPIFGKDAVGVELPNDKRQIVGLREILSSQNFNNPKSKLSVALGKDISGKIYVGDIEELTHLLIAGSTNSGKSVCINAIIISLIYKYSPRDVRLILVDPKRVELGVYAGIPHLLIPEIIKDAEPTIGALKWLEKEMLRRLELFEEKFARNISNYNAKVSSEEKLPRIVIIIDEFADMMMQSTKISHEMEDLIARLTRMARATGIHLILATQRPSVDYVTGPIKSNIPSRIAFATSSFTDSKIILDCAGAEKLLGKGDMLYLNRTPQPVRLQGVYLADSEVTNIIKQVKQRNVAYFDKNIENEIFAKENQNNAPDKKEIDNSKMDKTDPMFIDALEYLIRDGNPSISKVQRKFKMGFPRAGSLLDEMEERGFVSKVDNRYVLNITVDEFNELFKK